MIYVLLTFDPKRSRAVNERVFSDAVEAELAYRASEELLGPSGELEIVLIGTDRRESVYTTHGYYFESNLSAPWSELLDGL